MNKGKMWVDHATLSPSCFWAGWQSGRNWAAGVTLSSLENAVAKDQVFNKLALVSLFGSPMSSFATMLLVSQAKAKPLLPPTLPAHSHQSCSVNLHIYTRTYSFWNHGNSSSAFKAHKHEPSLSIRVCLGLARPCELLMSKKSTNPAESIKTAGKCTVTDNLLSEKKAHTSECISWWYASKLFP